MLAVVDIPINFQDHTRITLGVNVSLGMRHPGHKGEVQAQYLHDPESEWLLKFCALVPHLFHISPGPDHAPE